MPITSGSAGGIPGLNLKAWAYIRGDGTLIRGFNVASTSRSSAGVYVVSFTAAMSTANYVARVTLGPTGGLDAKAFMYSATTAAATLDVRAAGVAMDMGGLWEFYE